jgi:trehalose-6-phosphate synthase
MPAWMRQLFSHILRFALPLGAVMAIGAWLVVPFVASLMLRWAYFDLDNRTNALASAIQHQAADALMVDNISALRPLMDSAARDERLVAVAVCDGFGQALVATTRFPGQGCTDAPAAGSNESLLQRLQRWGWVDLKDVDNTYRAERPVELGGSGADGRMVFIYDLSYALARIREVQTYAVSVVAALGVVAALVSVTMAHLSWRAWIRAMRDTLLAPTTLLARRTPAEKMATGSEVQPLIGDLRQMVARLEEERRIREEQSVPWTPETLRRWLRDSLRDDEVIVIANREPYIHDKKPDGGVVLQRPASGLVTAIEPVMRACSGTWIAHGSGTADREMSDAKGRVAVPPEAPAYTLRRLWLTEEEEKGYYYGFANEGLWPLCHIAHVRPVFRRQDWLQYERVNRRFADAVVEEADSENPVVLVQDYHFALAPRMIRERLPQATILTFWHIPWPNAESFGVCPWREEILEGLLGSTILGFHTSFHVSNFMDTVDRYLEARIESDRATISHHGGEITRVNPYPISIHWPSADEQRSLPPVDECRAGVRAELGVPSDQLLGLGVDRLDYTKGIIERFTAVERMLELEPSLVGRFTLLQVAAPTRSSLPEYKYFRQTVEETAQRINERFGREGRPAIVLRTTHHDSDAVRRLYRAADVALVTSLHDGMNLVAKEFIAARDDERGVLILSQFTGAARELLDALVINPYDTDASAQALHRALTMPEAEQHERMRFMRSLVREHNIYRWAGRMLADAAQVRQRQRLRQRLREARQDAWSVQA